VWDLYLINDHVKGTVSQDFKVFFIIYDIKSVLSVWTLTVYNFFYSEFILIFKDEVLMDMAKNASLKPLVNHKWLLYIYSLAGCASQAASL
jgi:hypothetical protein